MIDFLRYRQNIILMITVVIIVLAVMRTAPPRPPFVSPLGVPPVSPIFLPLALKNRRMVPDARFGVAEYTPAQAVVLGLAQADYISGQWRLPLPGDTAFFLRPTERLHWSTWLLCSWSAHDGWYDEDGCREWVAANPGMDYVVGNELSICEDDIGDGYWVDAGQYAQWYRAAWELIKAEDPTASVAPYGAVGQVTGWLLLDVWDSYREQFGTLLPADFYSVHHYCSPHDSPDRCWTKLVSWIDWLEARRGTHWMGPRDYRVLEWGLPAWARPIPLEASLELMAGMAPRLQDNSIGITQHAWWASCNSGWRDQCTLLIRGGQVTELGGLYLELAMK